ncbi:MAG: hydantoinase/oxoprolinase family protein [Candidatus Helarchaeota archaeon]
MNILGFDIGGANIKASFVKNGELINNFLKYYPMWTSDLDKLTEILEKIKNKTIENERIDVVAITMTAELSDAFYTKREGIIKIINSLKEVFQEKLDNLYFITIYGTFIKIDEVLKDPLQIAAANWVATSKFVGKSYKNCILIDIGSTTTDIIPIFNGIPQCYGKMDPDRLLSGELIYTGVLRTEIPSITHYVPYKKELCRIASEKFALSADIHLVLGNITTNDYTSDTADGRQKDRRNSLARIARIICADVEILSEDEILEIANYIYSKQIEQIKSGLEQVFNSVNKFDLETTQIIITGLGSEFLARESAEKLGFKNILNLDNILGKGGGIVAPSASIALLLEDELKGV